MLPLDALCGAEDGGCRACSWRWLWATPNATAMPTSATLNAMLKAVLERQAEALGERGSLWSHGAPRSFAALPSLYELMPKLKQEPR